MVCLASKFTMCKINRSKILFLMKKMILLISLLFGFQFLSAQNGIIQGRVYNSINNEGVPFAEVLIKGTTTGTTTDIDGNYIIENLEPGLYNLVITFIGFQEKSVFEIQVTNSKPALMDIALSESAEELNEVVVKASPFEKKEESPVSLRTIGVAEIQRNPGGNRDISKVVQSLPGVTTTASFRNDLLIRGGAPNENRFYLDDVEVPNINHFATQGASGGPVGLINVDFIREVDFFSGAFPANRGNTLSSVFNFKQRDGRNDRQGFTFTLGSSDAGVSLEGPLGKKTTYLLSSRYSYLQFLFTALELPFLPTYTDFQAKVKVKLDQKNELTFIGLGAIDRFRLNLSANETEDQQYLLDNLPVNNQWNYTTGMVYKRYQDKGYWTFVASRNMLDNSAYKFENNDESAAKILDYNSQEIENKLRVEHTLRTKGFKFNYGLNYEFVKYNNRTFSRISTPIGEQLIDYASDLKMNKYAFFGQASKKLLTDRLVLSLGFRADGNSYSKEMSNPFRQFSPRFSLAYAFNEKWAVNFNSGLYYQLPPYTILGYKEGNEFVNKTNEITYIRNTHLVGGVEYNSSLNSKITLEGFLKYYQNYPFLLRDSITLANLGGDFGVIGNEPAVSNKQGRSMGMEFLFQQRIFKGYYGIFSYTLGWSQFEDKNGEYVASSWDSRHIVNITGGKRFKKNWEVGLSWRIQSGLPFTPFDEDRSALAANWDILGLGIRDYNQINTGRLNASHTLDLRVDKKWFFNKWSLNLYLDVENVYGQSVVSDVLVLDRDDEGNAQINPAQPNSYLLKYIEDAPGITLPSIGIVIAY